MCELIVRLTKCVRLAGHSEPFIVHAYIIGHGSIIADNVLMCKGLTTSTNKCRFSLFGNLKGIAIF